MTDVEKLAVVQQHDLRIRELENAIKGIPIRKQEEQQRLKDHKKALADAESALKSAQSGTKQLELDAESLRDKITKLRSQQPDLKTNQEFRAMEGEIKNLTNAISAVEDKELVVMEELEQLRAVVVEKQKALKAEESVLAEDVKHLDEETLRLQKDLDAIKQIRQAAAVDVDPQLVAVYERLFSRKDKALVAIEDGICTGCHLRVTPTVAHAARARNSVVTCNFCGRLVY